MAPGTNTTSGQFVPSPKVPTHRRDKIKLAAINKLLT